MAIIITVAIVLLAVSFLIMSSPPLHSTLMKSPVLNPYFCSHFPSNLIVGISLLELLLVDLYTFSFLMLFSPISAPPEGHYFYG